MAVSFAGLGTVELEFLPVNRATIFVAAVGLVGCSVAVVALGHWAAARLGSWLGVTSRDFDDWVLWYAPGWRRPIARSTPWTRNRVADIADLRLSVRDAHHVMLDDDRTRSVLAAYVRRGFGDVALSDVMANTASPQRCRRGRSATFAVVAGAPLSARTRSVRLSDKAFGRMAGVGIGLYAGIATWFAWRGIAELTRETPDWSKVFVALLLHFLASCWCFALAHHTAQRLGSSGDRTFEGVCWYAPGRWRPIARSTRKTRDRIADLARSGYSVRDAHDLLCWDVAAGSVLGAYVGLGLADVALSEIVVDRRSSQQRPRPRLAM